MKLAVAVLSLFASASAFTTSAPRAFNGVSTSGFAPQTT